MAKAGLSDRVDIRLADYRELQAEPFDAIASIGMVEHVGEVQIDTYAARLAELLKPGGRLLNHGITRQRHSDPDAGAFSERYVFPDAEPLHLSRVLLALERAGFVTQHVEGFGADYAETLRHWAERLDASLSEATRLAGEERIRVWRLYLRAARNGFRDRLHRDLPGARGAARRAGCRLRRRVDRRWSRRVASDVAAHRARRAGTPAGAEESCVEQQWGELPERDALCCPGCERGPLLIGGEAALGRTAEQAQHREIELAVTAVGGGIDQPGLLIAVGEDVAGPQVAVDAGGRLRWAGDVVDAIDEPVEQGGRLGWERARSCASRASGSSRQVV